MLSPTSTATRIAVVAGALALPTATPDLRPPAFARSPWQFTVVGGRTQPCSAGTEGGAGEDVVRGLIGLIAAAQRAGFWDPFGPHPTPPPLYPRGCLWVPVHGPSQLSGATVVVTATFPTGPAVVLTNTLVLTLQGRASAIDVVPVAYVPRPGERAPGHHGPAGIGLLTGVVVTSAGSDFVLAPNRFTILPPPR
jgi:hypothetical protein